MSQNDRILHHLKSGKTITPLQALRWFGSLCLHSRAAELRDRGYNVACRIVSRNGRRFGEYSLVRK